MNNYTQDAMAMFDKDSDELFNFNYDENLFGDSSTKQAAGKIIKILNEKSQELQKCFVDYLERYLYREYKINKEDCLSFVLSKQKESKHLNGKSLLTPDRLKNIFVKINFTPSRDYVFKLAFILSMQPEAVTELLQKGLRDRDFNFKNPLEVIYWYCLKHELGYSKVEKYLSQYNGLLPKECVEDKFTVDVYSEYAPKLVTVTSECEFMNILSELKAISTYTYHNSNNYYNHRLVEEFKEKYKYIQEDLSHVTNDKLSGFVDFGNPSGVSLWLYGKYGENEISVIKKDKFMLPDCILNNRLTDIKIAEILNEGTVPSRQDYVTICFLQNQLDPPALDKISDRLEDFCDNVNWFMEASCGLQELNPNNPYEYFILLCMSTEDPLATFQEVFIQSIKKEQ